MIIELTKTEDIMQVNQALLSVYPKIQDGKVFEVEIRKKRKKRSLDCNSYFWVLCQELAKVMRCTKEEIYRKYIKEYGDYVPMPIKADAVSKFCEIWASGGIGWLTEVVGDSKLKGYKLVLAYYGSSAYDQEQMSRLIDAIVEDCKEVGIDTRTPSEIAEMKAMWGV